MSTDELRAAADRLRRLKAGKEKSQDIYGVKLSTDNPRSAEFQEACRRVKRLMLDDERAAIAAFLDLHPADDADAVTAEWLESVGFAVKNAPAGTPYHEIRVDRKDDGDGLGNSSLTIRVHGPSEQWWPMDLWDGTGNGTAVRLWDSTTTRGIVRQLCAALGVPLVEAKP